MPVKQVQLFVGDDQVDIFDPESLRLFITFSIAELNKIDSRSGSRSKTVTVPATDINKQIFGFVENPNSVDALDQRTKPDTRLIVDGVTILTGSVKILDVILDGQDNIVEYKIQLIGDNGAWKTEIDELSLRDLDLSDQDHTWNKAAIDLSETISPVRIYAYPVTTYGEFDPVVFLEIDDFINLLNNDVEVTFDGAPEISWMEVGMQFRLSRMINQARNRKYTITQVNPNSVNATAAGAIGPGGETNSSGRMRIARAGSVQITSRYPAVNIKALFERIFLAAGYTIKSDFFNTTFGKRLYLPFTEKAFLHDKGFAVNQQFRAGMGADLDLTQNNTETSLPLTVDSGGEFFDNGGTWDTGGFKFVATKAVRQKFKLEMHHNSSFGGGRLRIRHNGAIIVQNGFDGNFVEETAIIESPYLDVEVGDEIIATVENDVIAQQINVMIIKASDTRFYNTTLDDIIKGSTVQLEPNLPDISQIDFIKGIKHLCNLYFSTNVLNREVTIEDRDGFYKEDEVIDWSEKIDVSRKRTFQFLGADLGKINRLEFQTGKDGIIKVLNDRQDLAFGSSENAIENKFTRKKVSSIKNPVFSATTMGPHPKIGFTQTLIPRLWEKYIFYPTWNTDHVPRVIYYNQVQSMQAQESWVWDNVTRTDFPHFYTFDNLTDNQNTVMFNDTLRSNGLFERFYRNTFKQINEGRIMTAWVNLNELDIGNLDFRKTIFIEIEGTGTYWQLEKISNYNPLDRKPTKCILLKTVETVEIKDIATLASGPQQPPEDELGVDPIFNPEPNNLLTTAEAVLEFDESGNLMNKNAGNTSDVDGAVVVGINLQATGLNQVVLGKNNVPDPDAQFIIGAGDPDNKQNVLKVDKEGNIQSGDSQTLYTEVKGIEVPMTYEDGDGNVQTMKI